jgi:ribonuclease T2
MLGVACANSVLQEVRICFSKDLRDFHACPEVSRQGCRVPEISVPPIL